MSKAKIHQGNGTFFHPPITVEEGTSETQLGELTDKHIRKIVLNFDLDSDTKIIVSEDGFICTIMNKTPEEKMKFLNVIFATFTTKFGQSHQMLNDDFSSFSWTEGNNSIEIGHVKGVYSIRNSLEYERGDPNTFHLWAPMPRTHILKDVLQGIIEQGYRFYQNPEFTQDILLIGEAWSLSYDKMQMGSFLYSWMIIENLIEVRWEKYIDSLTRSTNEKDFLKNPGAWSVGHYIQNLSFIKAMDDETRQSLNKLRKIRNEIVHDKRAVTYDEAYDCMNVATKLVYNKLNFGDDLFNKKIKLLKIPITYT